MDAEFKRAILELYPEFHRVTGPYMRKDGRQHIILNNTTKTKKEKGKLKTISYPKALIEAHFGRRLSPQGTIDHLNKDPLDNRIENLQVLSRSEHAKLDVRRRAPVEVACVTCGKILEATSSQIHNKSLVFSCSKRCSGLYGQKVQVGKVEKPQERSHLTVEYFTNKDPPL